ncbi:MAG TPA: MmgE/PrpD family protein [Stellaceae bacterium]|jgi:2-methylcitrate dehydratase PrpD|nr:MmgE/PrpD family protein [Stellaceae bacterium]
MTILQGIAERIGAITYADLPAEAVHWATMAILDTVGVTLAGAAEPCAQITERVLAGSGAGDSLIFGGARRATPLDAALINGTASHALDFDDVSNSLGGHPSAPIVPALFALGEMLDRTGRPISGRDFIAAYVAGFETETRIGRGVHFHHYEKGWHPTATLGVFGATAACCHLLGLDTARTAQALAIAASLASGIKANFGTMTKPLHVGHTARNGLFAALMARDGFTANPGALEHKQGFLMVFNGAGNFDADKILKDWGNPYDIVRPGLAIKQHPCCGSTHPAIDAMLLLRGEHDIPADRVVRIDSWTHPRRLAHTDRPDPQSGLDAKFSVQYCLAKALMNGRVVLEDFEGDAFRDGAPRALMQRIHAAPHPEMGPASGEYLGAEVRVTFDDGHTIARKVGAALGRGPDDPLPPEALTGKFANCASRALPPAQVARLQALLLQLDQAPGLGDIIAAIEVSGAEKLARRA